MSSTHFSPGNCTCNLQVGVSQSEELGQLFDSNLHKKHLLLSGSQVLQVRGATQVMGVVINTGGCMLHLIGNECHKSKPQIGFILFTDIVSAFLKVGPIYFLTFQLWHSSIYSVRN